MLRQDMAYAELHQLPTPLNHTEACESCMKVGRKDSQEVQSQENSTVLASSWNAYKIVSTEGIQAVFTVSLQNTFHGKEWLNFQAMFEKLKSWKASHNTQSQKGWKESAIPFCGLITLTYISIFSIWPILVP